MTKLFAVLMLSITALSCEAQALHLECDDSAKETAAIQARAPGVVKRISKHVLEIRTPARTLTIKDQPPFDEPFSGVHHTFCDRKDGFILLSVTDEDVWTGKLINEQTGEVTPAGGDVIFSPDRRAYFAREQPNGLDGNRWKIYALNGKLSWSGFSFIEVKNMPGHMQAYLENPAWLANGEFSAKATCIGGHNEQSWNVKLIKGRDGWSWKPGQACRE
jgi:hypothetical protein